MSKPKLIVMLTWHDVTVADAEEVFRAAKDAPARCWGFKSNGISRERAKALVEEMKAAGKETFLEVLAIDEASCLADARFAAACGFDYLLGTVYYESVRSVTAAAGVKYMPFVGLDADTRLRGTVEDIVREAAQTEKLDVAGISISGFRYVSGEPEVLLSALAEAMEKPVCVEGSVNSYQRLAFIREHGFWGFTIGGAFFEHVFGDTFSGQIVAVESFLEKG